MPTTLTNGIQLPDKGSVDWYSSMQSNYNLIDTHLGDTDVHVTAEDKDNWNSKQGSLSQDQLDAIAQVATNTDDIATLQSDKADASHTHSSSDITDIDDYATKDYVDNSISGLVDNAPDALNTLNELSAALNDDSNFASTVTTALAAKADSADLATVATSGSYDDLDDKPTIPANTSDLTNDSGFVTLNDFDIPSKTSDLTNDSGFITLNDVPTGTSDLINDSNFVDTSNAAVSSGITSAKVSDYDTHIADTDIHVTTADKNRWNNNTYVFRYSSTALTPSSINSNALLDNTDNLKVGDKVIDSSGVLFSITAIDTANSTFSIGTALIDLAQDSDVVHKSGDETKSGELTLSDKLNSSDVVPIANNSYSSGSSSNQWNNIYSKNYYYNGVAWGLDKANTWSDNNIFSKNVDPASVTSVTDTTLAFYGLSNTIFLNTRGSSNRRSYGSFLFAGYGIVSGVDNYGQIQLLRSTDKRGDTNDGYIPDTSFKMWRVAPHSLIMDSMEAVRVTNDGTENSLKPITNNATDLGTSDNKWKTLNGVEPSSLGMPDLDNGIDISSYITISQTGVEDVHTSTYTPTVNGFISVCLSRNGVCGVGIEQGDMRTYAREVPRSDLRSRYAFAYLPVVQNVQVNIISCYADGIVSAKFFPCQGNV